MTINSTIRDFAASATQDALRAFRGLAATGTISPSGTVNFVERVPGEQAAVSIGYNGPFFTDRDLEPTIHALDGTVLDGARNGNLGGARYLPLFRAHDDLTSVSHFHTPYLGAWSQSHRPLPIRYVPVQRWTRAREIPIYIDRRGGEANFILNELTRDDPAPAILEANGGSTAWGYKGLLALANDLVLLEEGARLQALAETLGGSKPYGPGVLEQQWKMSGLIRDTDQFEVASAA
ncbi:MAG: class II aldolase/adducin family protein [Sphingomonas sp.]